MVTTRCFRRPFHKSHIKANQTPTMKFSAAFLALTVASASAFAPATPAARASSALSMAQGETSRGEFIQQSLAAAAALTLLPGNANAGWLAGSPEVIDPKDAEVDRDILASEEVQKALTSVKNYKALIEGFSSTLASDPQADIGPTIRKELDFVKIRTDLNTLNTAFDEDTQRGTDRLIRAILQDITELETANKQKPGVPRSEIRLNAMKGKIAKLGKAFDEYLAFSN